MGARAAAGGLAFINSVGNLGGFFGPFLMGKLKEQSGGNFELGLYASAGLMILASMLAFKTLTQKKPIEIAPLKPVEAVALR